MEIQNAIIKTARISIEREILTASLYLIYGDNTSQSFGGYSLFSPTHNYIDGRNYTGLFIWRVMEVVGVDEWGDLVGRAIRVCIEDGMADSIGHIVKDKWFDPKNELKAMEKAG